MEMERLSSIPIWVRFLNLPLHLWNVDCLSRIGSLIGSPLFLDSATLRCSKTTFVRLCVEIEASSPLPDAVSVEIAPGLIEKFKVDYDWRPTACKHCLTFGHNEARCCKKPIPDNDAELGMPGHPGRPSSTVDKGKGKANMTSTSAPMFQPPKKIANKLLRDAQKANTPTKEGNLPPPPSKQGSAHHANSFLPLQEIDSDLLPKDNIAASALEKQIECPDLTAAIASTSTSISGLPNSTIPAKKCVHPGDNDSPHNSSTTAMLSMQTRPSSDSTHITPFSVAIPMQPHSPNAQQPKDDVQLSQECTVKVNSNAPMFIEPLNDHLKGIDLAIYLPISEMHMAEQSLSSSEDSRGKPNNNKKKHKVSAKFKQQALISATSTKWIQADQFVHCKASPSDGSSPFFVTAVYASNSTTDRQSLWADLVSLASYSIGLPWLIGGDFNEVRYSSEKMGGRQIHSRRASRFNQCIEESCLQDLRSVGGHFSWSNNQDNRIACKLDNALVNLDWTTGFADSFVHVLSPGLSDHSALLVTVKPPIPTGPRPFKYFQMWISPGLLQCSKPSLGKIILGISYVHSSQEIATLKGHTETMESLLLWTHQAPTSKLPPIS
ncbi:hypothetical protein QJS10_CPB12g00475 [Acorus calamus]|uniref:DUF4283 domain-containing protein n=1 Tax=Acorus calamus TaxID=4465 RepID=A0AAV9DQL0_ACOCL|nr:hypothetical protein QJS10_CPB12g00475 [Acorus calamus]